MPRAVLFLAAFLSLANAQAPRSAVYSALAPESQAVVPLADLVKGFDAAAQVRALETLDKLDRAPLNAKELSELSEAYRLLGRTDRALETASQISTRGGGAGDATLQVQALAGSGDFKGAQAAAEAALKKYPADPNLLAAYHQVKNRAPTGPNWTTPTAEASRIAQAGGLIATDSRPFVLAIKTGRSGIPPMPALTGDAYLAPNAVKPSGWTKFTNSMSDLWSYNTDSESPAEKRRMAELRAGLQETETGRQLIADLGGWTEIDKKVDLLFHPMANDGTNAYARRLISPDSQGHTFVVAVNTKLMNEPEGVAVPALGHELSHVRDNLTYGGDHALAIPSEYAAHRTQIQIYEEMRAKMTPGDLAKVNGTARGSYQNFVSMLWEDHLQARFGTPDKLAIAMGDPSKYAARATKVLSDLRSGVVAPGSPQIDYHLNAPTDGLYRFFTNEKDIADLVAEREASGNYDPEQRKKDQSWMKQRQALLDAAKKRDDAFRLKFGFEIGEQK